MRLLRALAAAVLLAGVFGVSVPADAATPPPATGNACNCWCTSTQGAVSDGTYAGSAACSTACKAKGQKMVSCSTKASELPANNLRCFESEDVCKLNCAGPSVPGEKTRGYIYDKDYQPTECPKNFRYCYCLGTAYELNYKIPNPDPSKPPIGEVADLGSYVNTVYRYLLGISGIVAIVMVMVGGLQYVTAVGTGNVKAAKERINNAVIGLILLFAAALILQTVNPRLLTLQPPRLPALKRIEIVDQNSNCKILADKGYTIEGHVAGQEKPCGTKAVVLKDANKNDVAEGTVCTYRGCTDKTKACFISGDKGMCLSCGEVVPGNDLGVTPASNVCSQLQKSMEENETLATNHPYCFWTRDPYALFGANWRTTKAALATALGGAAGSFLGPAGSLVGAGVGASVGGALELRYGTCAEMTIECRRIESLSCEGYNDLEIRNKVANDSDLKNISPGWGDQDMKTICESNPCKWSPGCSYVPETNTCRTAGSGVSMSRCTLDSQCDNGNVCITGRCVRPNPNMGANNQPCREDKSCNDGLRCVRALPSGGGGYTDVCTNGAVGSACDDHADCGTTGYCSEELATRTRCVAKKTNGTACDDHEECSSGKCEDNDGLFTGDSCQP